jgi:hypothetical protein
MAGVLDEIFRVRTNGNGYFQQGWDHLLLLRDLKTLSVEGRIEEVECPQRQSKYPPDYETKRFRDLETGDLYEYNGPGERASPRFRKVNPD